MLSPGTRLSLLLGTGDTFVKLGTAAQVRWHLDGLEPGVREQMRIAVVVVESVERAERDTLPVPPPDQSAEAREP